MLLELDGWILLLSLKGSEQNSYSRAFYTVIGGSVTCYTSFKDFKHLIFFQGIIQPFINMPLQMSKKVNQDICEKFYSLECFMVSSNIPLVLLLMHQACSISEI